jgi:hypothetical protein
MSNHLGALTQRLVHPTSPVLLTKNGPLRVYHFLPDFTKAKSGVVPI